MLHNYKMCFVSTERNLDANGLELWNTFFCIPLKTKCAAYVVEYLVLNLFARGSKIHRYATGILF